MWPCDECIGWSRFLQVGQEGREWLFVSRVLFVPITTACWLRMRGGVGTLSSPLKIQVCC